MAPFTLPSKKSVFETAQEAYNARVAQYCDFEDDEQYERFCKLESDYDFQKKFVYNNEDNKDHQPWFICFVMSCNDMKTILSGTANGGFGGQERMASDTFFQDLKKQVLQQKHRDGGLVIQSLVLDWNRFKFPFG